MEQSGKVHRCYLLPREGGQSAPNLAVRTQKWKTKKIARRGESFRAGTCARRFPNLASQKGLAQDAQSSYWRVPHWIEWGMMTYALAMNRICSGGIVMGHADLLCMCLPLLSLPRGRLWGGESYSAKSWARIRHSPVVQALFQRELLQRELSPRLPKLRPPRHGSQSFSAALFQRRFCTNFRTCAKMPFGSGRE